MVLSFFAHMTLYRGDTISVTLPGFTGTTGAVALAPGKGASSLFTSAWDQKRFRLTFTYASDTPRAGAQVTSIYTNPHVVVDVHGTPDDSAKILIEVSAAEGPVKPIQVQRSIAIAPLVLTSQVSFTRNVCDFRGFRWHCERRQAEAGLEAEMLFELRLSKSLALGSTLTLQLADFQGASLVVPVSDSMLVPLSLPLRQEVQLEYNPYGCTSNAQCASNQYTGTAAGGALSRASWNAGTSQLILTSTRDIAENATIYLVVPSSAGIRLPVVGVPLSSIGKFVTQFSFNMEGEITPLSDFTQLATPIGAFKAFALTFNNQVIPGELIIFLQVSFECTMSLTPGDTITIRLEGFRGDNKNLRFKSETGDTSWMVLWDEGMSTLEISSLGAVEAYSQVTIILSRGGIHIGGGMNGIVLIAPVVGTQRIDPAPLTLDVSATAVQGQIPRLPLEVSFTPGISSVFSSNATIQRIPAMIDSTTLSFISNADFSQPPILPSGGTRMRFGFCPTVVLSVGDIIRLFLPGFGVHGNSIDGALLIRDVNGALLMKGYWMTNEEIPHLQMVVQLCLLAWVRVEVTIDSSDNLGILLPTLGVTGAVNGKDVYASSTSRSGVLETVAVSARVDDIEMPKVRVENVDHVFPAITESRLEFETPRAGQNTGVTFLLMLTPGWQLLAGDEIHWKMPEFSQESTGSVNSAVSSTPPGSIASAKWSKTDEKLVLTLSKSVSGQAVFSLLQQFKLALPTSGLTSDRAHKYSFYIFRGPRQIISVTNIKGIQLVTAVSTPLMRFLPIPKAGSIVEIRIWLTMSCPLPKGSILRWRMPGFQGDSMPKILTGPISDYPTQTLPEASWLSDDGSGAGLLGVQVGSADIKQNTLLRIVIPSSAGIRLPISGMPACTEGDECKITMEYDSPLTGSLLRTPFEGSDLVGIATTSTLELSPRQVETALDVTLLFRTSFDIRVDDLLQISLKGFSLAAGKAQQSLPVTATGGLCPLDGIAQECFGEATVVAETEASSQGLKEVIAVTVMTFVKTAVPRGNLVTLKLYSSAGIILPSRGLPRTPSSDGPAGRDLVSFKMERRYRRPLTSVLPGSGLRDEMLSIIPMQPFAAAPVVGSFGPSASLEMTPPSPGVVIQMVIRLRPTMLLRILESIYIDLPGFKRVTKGQNTPSDLTFVWFKVETGEVQRFQNATWDQTTSRISLVNFGADMMPGIPVVLTVDTSQAFITPPNGIQSIEEWPRISTNAHDGFVDRTPLKTQLIEPFLINSRASYKPSAAGAISEITIQVETTANLATEDMIRFTLGNFTGGLWCWDSGEFVKSRCVTTPSNSMLCVSCEDKCKSISGCEGCHINRGSLSPGAVRPERMGCFVRVRTHVSPSLILDSEGAASGCQCQRLNTSSPVNASLADLNSVWARLETADGLKRAPLPSTYGASCNPWDFSPGFGTGAPSCADLWPVPPADVSCSKADGACGSASVKGALVRSQLGLWCCLPWCFVDPDTCPAKVRWAGDPRFWVSYDTCARNDRAALINACPFPTAAPAEGKDMTGSWVGASTELVLTLTRQMQRGSTFSVQIPKEAKIALPEKGLDIDDRFLVLDARNKMGSMTPSPIHSSQPVGAFDGRKRISFGPAAAARPAPISLEFALQGNLRPGDQVCVTLPAFDDSVAPKDTKTDSFMVGCSSNPSKIVSQCSWDQRTQELTMFIAETLEKRLRIVVTVFANQILLPAAGIRAMAPHLQGFRIWIKSSQSPVQHDPPTWIEDVQPVGAFWYTSLAFEPAIINTPTSIHVTFVLMMPMKIEDVIEIRLPGFQGPVETVRVAPKELLPAQAFTITWSQLAKDALASDAAPALLSLKMLRYVARVCDCVCDCVCVCVCRSA